MSVNKTIFFFLIYYLLVPTSLFALDISSFSNIPIKNDVLLYPAKVELALDKGASAVKYVDVLNRMGRDGLFSVEVEDFSFDQVANGISLGKTVGGLDSSLKNYITIPETEFVLKHGQQAHIPVEINIPKGVPPGGLYGVVLVSSKPLNNSGGSTNIVTRIGALFFIKVSGDVKQSGKLSSFVHKDQGFDIEFENSGDIYLNPYGIINVYEYYSRKLVKKVTVDPWFVLPHSSRVRSVSVNDIEPGKYAAEITLNRGYDNLVDNKYSNFEILKAQDRFSQLRSYFLIAALIFGLLILIFYVKF